MTKEEIIQAIVDDKTMPFIQQEQLAGIVDFVIKNYKPLLLSNLDEAAEKYSNIPYNFGEFVEIEYEFGDPIETIVNDKVFVKDAFKAGVAWHAGQGITKEAVIGMATEEIFIKVSEQTLDELDLRPGDKVVVQIRKK